MASLAHEEHDDRMPATGVRIATVIACASIVGSSVYVALLAAGLAKGLALGGTAAMAVPVSLLGREWLPTRLGGAGSRHRVIFALFLLLSGVAAYRLGHLSVYMLDASNKAFALNPPARELPEEAMNKPFFLKHNCFTCYVVAAHLASEEAENIYSRERYRNTETPTPIHETIGDVLTIDQYQYPPPFLILPKALMAFGHDFFQIRTFWFALNVVVFCITAIALATWLGGPTFSAYWLSIPLVLLATTTLTSLEIGNVHFLIISMSLLGVLMLERRRYAIGGALLGYCVVGKIFPGVLLAYLVFARRWKAVVATGIAMIAYGLIAFAMFGDKPFVAFVEYQLPRIASGEAFSFAFEALRPLVLNLSVMGLPYRLDKLGLLGGMDPAATAKIVIWVYTVVLGAVVVMAGLRTAHVRSDGGDSADSKLRAVGANRRYLVLVWLALLSLGQMRSPFLPWGYGSPTNLWLISLLLAMSGGSIVRIVPLASLWALCFFAIPLAFGPTTVAFDLAYVLAAVVIILVLCFVLVLRRAPVVVAPEPA